MRSIIQNNEGMITIPPEIMEVAQIRPDDEILFELDGECIRISKAAACPQCD